MSEKSKDEQITVREVEQRLRATLKGAFRGPPTPLKDMRKATAKKNKRPAKRVDR